MRIIFVGNAGRRNLGQQYYSTDNIIAEGLIQAGHTTYFFSDRDELQGCKPLGFLRYGAEAKLNQQLLTVAKNFQPHMLLLSHANLITNKTLAQLRVQQPHLRIGQLSIDAIYAPKNNQHLKDRRGFLDALFITSGGKAIGQFGTTKAPAYFLPNPISINIDTYKVFEKPTADLSFDMAYFAHATRRSRDDFSRIQIARDLQTALPQLRCAYAGFDNLPSKRGVDFTDTLGQTAMGLSLSRRVIDHVDSTDHTRFLYASDRIARLMGNGLLTFIQNGFGLETLYPTNSAVFFNDAPDLIEKVAYYLQHDSERQTIAQTGHSFVHQHMSAKLCAQYMVDRTMAQNLSHAYAWPTTGFFDV